MEKQPNKSDENKPGMDNADQDGGYPTGPSRTSPELMRIWGGILQLGLGELSVKLGVGILSIAMVLLVAWVMGNFYLSRNGNAEAAVLSSEEPITLPTAQVEIPSHDVEVQDYFVSGVQRFALLHTNL
ncbi:MAG: hypothetical protein AAGU05_06840, partial [Anaerolineaceae bacterium]